jgi:hypothetical protein
VAHQHRTDVGPSIGPGLSVTNSVEDQMLELNASFEKLLEALNMEWCEKCNTYVQSDPEETVQDPEPHLLDELNPDGPNYFEPVP